METTTETREVWHSPTGVACYLTPVALILPEEMPDLPEDYEPWYPEGPGERPPVRYHLVSCAGGTVVEDHTVYPYEPWSWYDAISDWLIKEGWEGPPPTAEELEVCEHGLSARLCAGPMHYPDDDRW